MTAQNDASSIVENSTAQIAKREDERRKHPRNQNKKNKLDDERRMEINNQISTNYHTDSMARILTNYMVNCAWKRFDRRGCSE